ncbi:unnamed protein product [Psylliodes chrysocephalus]|uniref:Uncharacterized protein n=1 Tax=Psylliodes chrysocephalus TaxID=3402493 RepID=A0A9P0D0P5_9CUCU|nr:unnamed protein product [Psylliodes chrysocephala]
MKNSPTSTPMASEHIMKNNPASTLMASEYGMKNSPASTPTASENGMKNSPASTPTASEHGMNDPSIHLVDWETVFSSGSINENSLMASEHGIKNSPASTPTTSEHPMKSSPASTPTASEHGIKNSPSSTQTVSECGMNGSSVPLFDWEPIFSRSSINENSHTASEHEIKNSPPSTPTIFEFEHETNSLSSTTTASERGMNNASPTPTISSNSSINENAPKAKKPPRKKFNVNPRYLGDVSASDMENPMISRRILKLSKQKILQQNRKICALQTDNRKLKHKVQKLSALTKHLQQCLFKCWGRH